MYILWYGMVYYEVDTFLLFLLFFSFSLRGFYSPFFLLAPRIILTRAKSL